MKWALIPFNRAIVRLSEGMTQKFQFQLNATDGKARTGVINTPRGEIRTSASISCGLGEEMQSPNKQTGLSGLFLLGGFWLNFCKTLCDFTLWIRNGNSSFVEALLYQFSQLPR